MGKMNSNIMDVHGAGAQRSDPKSGKQSDYPQFKGPQGDVLWVYNYVRCVRNTDNTSINPYRAPFKKDSFQARIIGSKLILAFPTYQSNVTVTMYQINGKKLVSFKSTTNIASMKKSFLLPFSQSPGLYIISLQSKDNVLKQSIVVR